MPRWLLIALLIMAASGLAWMGCDDDDDHDDDNNDLADDDATDDDDSSPDDDDAAPDDDDLPPDDDDEPPDDDDVTPGDDDDDDDAPRLTGPVDLDGDAGLELLVIATCSDGTYPDITYTYEAEVRDADGKAPVWSHTYEVYNGTMTFALADLDQDGTYEIVETTNVTAPAIVGRAAVRDGNADFAVAFDTGDLAGVSLYARPFWDIDADGRPELLLKANPELGVGRRGWLAWYDGTADYEVIKRLQGNQETYVDVYAHRQDRWITAVEMDGAKGLEYLYVENRYDLDSGQWAYTIEVRRHDDDEAVWTQEYALTSGSRTFSVADLDADDTFEIVESYNYYEDTAMHGRTTVRDGDEDFDTVFDTETVDNASLYGFGDYDIDDDGVPELLVQKLASGDGAGWWRWYEAADGWNEARQHNLPVGGYGYLLTAERNGRQSPMEMGGKGRAYGLVTYATSGGVTAYTIQLLAADGATILWQNAYDVTDGSMSFGMADLDDDGIYELIETVNYNNALDGASAPSGKTDVRDGDAAFAIVFNTQAQSGRRLYATGGWDVDRDGQAELFIDTQPESGAGLDIWARWHEGAGDYEQVKEIDAAAPAIDLQVLGAAP